MQALAALAWSKLPSWLRWVLILATLLIYTPLRVREEAAKFIDNRVWAIVTPLKERRDMREEMNDKRLERIENKVDQLILMETKGNK